MITCATLTTVSNSPKSHDISKYELCSFFFFQAEDGIRDDLVTGVQTCALPICSPRPRTGSRLSACRRRLGSALSRPRGRCCTGCARCWCARAGTGWPAWRKWTRPISAGGGRRSPAAGGRARRGYPLPPGQAPPPPLATPVAGFFRGTRGARQPRPAARRRNRPGEAPTKAPAGPASDARTSSEPGARASAAPVEGLLPGLLRLNGDPQSALLHDRGGDRAEATLTVLDAELGREGLRAGFSTSGRSIMRERMSRVKVGTGRS